MDRQRTPGHTKSWMQTSVIKLVTKWTKISPHIWSSFYKILTIKYLAFRQINPRCHWSYHNKSKKSLVKKKKTQTTKQSCEANKFEKNCWGNIYSQPCFPNSNETLKWTNLSKVMPKAKNREQVSWIAVLHCLQRSLL